jgi:phage regulator Rha-like protein
MERSVYIIKTARGYELFKKEHDTPAGAVFTSLAGGRAMEFTEDYLKRFSPTMEELEERINGKGQEAEKEEEMDR